MILAKVKLHNTSKTGIIHNVEPDMDMFAEVLSVGEEATGITVGQFVMFRGGVPMLELPFEEDGEHFTAVLGSAYEVVATYKPDPGETRIFVPERKRVSSEDKPNVKVHGSGALGEWANEKQDILS